MYIVFKQKDCRYVSVIHVYIVFTQKDTGYVRDIPVHIVRIEEYRVR